MTATTIFKCWICGDVATTGEHKTKRTDLLALREPTQSDPAYFHDANRPNQLIRSLDAKVLKSTGRLCASCNNARTQPHDRAWEKMSKWIRVRRPALQPGNIVRANRIFKDNTKRQMLGVHLFFVKLFGCMIMESDKKIPIDTASLGDAILSDSAHPNVYLKFASSMNYFGRSDLELQHSDDFAHVFACWMYQLTWITVIVMFATPGEQRNGLINAWHPRYGTNKLKIADGNPQASVPAL